MGNVVTNGVDFSAMTDDVLLNLQQQGNTQAAAAELILKQRRYQAIWAAELETFGFKLLEAVKAERAKPEAERLATLVVNLSTPRRAWLIEVDGYSEVKALLEKELGVEINYEQVPGKGQGLWEDEPYVKVLIEMNPAADTMTEYRAGVVAGILDKLKAAC